MSGWRWDVGRMRESITGTPSEGWRADWLAIARANGHDPGGWREAVRLWAGDYGVASAGWRGEILGVAAVLGVGKPGGWRANLAFLREHFGGEPPALRLFFLHTPPRIPSASYVVLADGVLEADKIIMA